MANTELGYSDHVRYTLQNGASSSIRLAQEPDGWRTDELEIVRHDKYHGVFTQFTNSLKFYNEARSYINQAFEVSGINTRLYLIKEVLVKSGDDVKWELDYLGIADFETWSDEKGYVSINFNSNDLETLIKSHESDVFELERKESIDGENIGLMTERDRKVFLSGRTMIDQSHSRALEPNKDTEWFIYRGTPKTSIVIQGHPRHSSVDVTEVNPDTTLDYPSNMFFVDDVASTEDIEIDISWDLEFSIVDAYTTGEIGVRVFLEEWEFDGSKYVRNSQELLTTATYLNTRYKTKGSVKKTGVSHKAGYMLILDASGSIYYGYAKAHIYKWDIRLTTKSWKDGTFHRFAFVNDVMSRLMQIITGKRRKFYSKLFGRSNEPRSNYNEYRYENPGKYGKIGLISGFWARQFDPLSDKYKSIQLSLKDAIESLQCVFNVGVAIETIGYEQRLRIEDLKYFYQNEVVIRLPHQVENLKRSTHSDLYFSATKLGYVKGGDYRDEVGLDEPNTQTSHVTPLRATTNKFEKLSSIRTDEYGLELLRRKPQVDFPEEDTGSDEDNWMLDLKETEGPNWTQVEWQDRLEQEPTGILSPDTYRSFLFTPLRMLFRHGWVVRAGMEQSANLRKFLRYINAKANKGLRTWFKGEDKEYGESDDIKVSELERPRFLPQEIEFTHPVNDELMRLIKGKTEIEVEGSIEAVPNVYFKIEFINDKGEKETGYLLQLKPNVTGKFKLLKANENLIF